MKEKNEKIDIRRGLRGYGVVFIVFALIFALAPIGVFKILSMQRETLSWPTVEGTVIVCEIEHRVNEHADHDEEDEYRIDLVYQYTVDNETYEGSNVYYWSGTGSDWDHELDSYEWSLLRDYPVGSNVTVFYNPDNPERSCLIAGENPEDRTTDYDSTVTGYMFLLFVPIFYLTVNIGKKIAKKKKEKKAKSFMTPALEEKMKKIKEETES